MRHVNDAGTAEPFRVSPPEAVDYHKIYGSTACRARSRGRVGECHTPATFVRTFTMIRWPTGIINKGHRHGRAPPQGELDGRTLRILGEGGYAVDRVLDVLHGAVRIETFVELGGHLGPALDRARVDSLDHLQTSHGFLRGQ